MDFAESFEDSCSAVGLAARKGDLIVLQKLLGKGADYCVKDNRGWFPIHEASFHGHAECVRELLNVAYANNDDPIQIWPSPYDINDRNALVLAARNGHLETMKELLHLYPFDSEDFFLAIEASLDFPKLFSFLLSKYEGDINRRNKWKSTLLHTAVCSSPIDTIDMILSYKIDIEAKDLNGRSPLHCACSESRKDLLEVVKLLIKNGSNVNSCDNEGCSVLFIAVQKNNLPIIKYLLKCNADPYRCFPIANSFDSVPIYYAAPICIAAEKGSTDAVKLLIKCVDKNVLLQKNILSPVVPAIGSLNIDCLKLLLKNGYDIPIDNAMNYFPTEYLCEHDLSTTQNVLEMFAFLLNEGVSIGLLSKNAFMLRVLSNSNQDVVILFCKFGVFESYFSSVDILRPVQKFLLQFISSHHFILSDLVYKNICIVVNWIPLVAFKYSSRTKLVTNVVHIVPPLSHMCRCFIRYLILQNFGSVMCIDLLPLPVSLKRFMWCDDVKK